MTIEFWILGGLLAGLAGLLIWFRRRDAARLKRRTREVLSPRLQREIEAERTENLEKKRKFEAALKAAERPKSS